jgi:hypothetical protein
VCTWYKGIIHSPIGHYEPRCEQNSYILASVSIPLRSAEGLLPLGRYLCDLDELEAEFVDDAQFAGSSTRGEIFTHLLAVIEMFKEFSADLIESIWIGGSFVTDKPDPDDIDCLFVLNGAVFDGLSNSKRQNVQKFNRKGMVRDKLSLRVETFILVRVAFANPWERGGVHPDAAPYTQVRGAWDDWWLRVRTGEGPDDPPRIESAEPKRGYLEVLL